MSTNEARPPRGIQNRYTHLAVLATALSILVTTLAGAWVEARRPNAPGTCVTVEAPDSANTTETLWLLQRIDGVGHAVAVFRGSLTAEDIEGTGWRDAWFYTNQTDVPGLAFLPPDPILRLHQGRLPDALSADKAVVGYELAQALHVGVGDSLAIHGQPFEIAGIWRPSARLPGNFAQISAVAAGRLMLSTPQTPHHFVVLPASGQEATQIARRIWRKLPQVRVLSPEWEAVRTRREQVVSALSLSGAIVLTILLSVPLLTNLRPQRELPTAVVAVLSGIGGLIAGYGVALAVNRYTGRTLGLTPFQVTPRLALAVFALAGGSGLPSVPLNARLSWAVRYVATALALALCTTALVTIGTLNSSLNTALGEAQRTAADWVNLPGAQASATLLRDVARLPGIRGYTIEGYGGLANEDEERWIGPWPSSGIFYGIELAGGEGTLSVPYRLGYWYGGPLDPAKPDEVVIGYDLAQEQGLKVGDMISIRHVPFTVVGIRERLRYDPRNDANWRIDMSMESFRRVLHDPFAAGEITLLIPPAKSQEEKTVFLQEIGARLNVGQVLTVEERMAEIARSYPAAWTLTRAGAGDAIRHAKSSYASLFALCGGLLLAASALAVNGTMMDRVVRDELRVSLLKALGADEGTLLGQYLQMASILGVAGVAPGILGGWTVCTLLNRSAPFTTAELIFTPQLAAGISFFVVLTAMVAALAPASRAARQDGTWTLYSTSPTQAEASSPLSGKIVHGGCES